MPLPMCVGTQGGQVRTRIAGQPALIDCSC